MRFRNRFTENSLPGRNSTPDNRQDGLIRGLVALVSVGFVCTAVAAEPCDPRASTAPVPPSQAGAVPPLKLKIEATSSESELNGTTHLTGPVDIQYGQQHVTAEQADYSDPSQEVDVVGKVTYQNPQVTLSGMSGHWNPNGTGQFLDTHFEIPGRNASGTAERIELLTPQKTELTTVRYTTCPINQPAWLIKAQSIVLDQNTETAIARQASLNVEGIPLLYLPLLEFPISDQRRSGFLFPIIGQSGSSGLQLQTPYYFNLAPNYDLTSSPGYSIKRGWTFNNEFRYLTDSSTGDLKIDWLPEDQVANADRGYLRFENTTDLSNHLRLTINTPYVSDSHYFQDFGAGTEVTSVTYLDKTIGMEYADNNWWIRGLIDQFQTIDLSIAPADRPATRIPSIALIGSTELSSGFTLTANGAFDEFKKLVGVDGARLRLDPSVSYTIHPLGININETAGVSLLSYQLQNAVSGAPTQPTVVAPFEKLEGSLLLERTDGNLVTQVEPKALYSYTPYRNQSQLPVFDSALADLNSIELFRGQRYQGLDRIEDQNQLAVGLTDREITRDDGRQWLSTTVGQIIYFSPPKVTLPTETAANIHSSNLVGQLELNATNHLNLSLGELWNPHLAQSALTEARLSYHPDGDKVLNLSYRYRRDLLEQVEMAFAWPINRRWGLFARDVYSLKERTQIDTFAGFQYQACCFKVELLTRHYVSSFDGSRNTSIVFQVELGGLSNVSDRVGSFLEQAIRGYSPSNSTLMSH